jgi:hypothetical protein
LAILAALWVASVSPARASSPARTEDHFGIKQYNEFHDVLHPLEHEALPARDFARIRSKAGELVRRGRAIVRFGVPKNLEAKQAYEFRKELRKFSKALSLFDRAAKRDKDTQLESSFSAVHDSFEMLVGMLPRK